MCHPVVKMSYVNLPCLMCRYGVLFTVQSSNIALYLLMYFRSAGIRSRILALSSHVQVHSQCCQMAKFDPFLSLDCAPTPSTLAQPKERKGSNFAIWKPCRHHHRFIASAKLIRTVEWLVEEERGGYRNLV